MKVDFRNDILPLKDALFRLALRITLNSTEAEDIVQETMLKLWSRRDRWDDIDNIEGFAMTICRNLSLDAIEKKERLNISLDETVHDRPDTSRTQDEELMKQQQLNTVMHIIGQLPEKQRTIMQLRDIEGKSYQEIADIMSINVSDVKVNLFRARQKVVGSINKES